jgi:hypothetical protein
LKQEGYDVMASRNKLWFGLGAFVLAGNDASALPPESHVSDTVGQPVAEKTKSAFDNHSRSVSRLAQAWTLGAGGEAGEGGEGGEAGINVEAAGKDPVEYGIALQVIAAHYHAGLAAYEGGEKEAGAQMFAHGLSEVYVEMEDVFKRLGVKDLGQKLEVAVEVATANKPVSEVRRRVKDVYAALNVAEKAAPKSSLSAQAARAQVAAEMVERAAAQYAVVQTDKNLEPYLDGLGFAIAARSQAKGILPWLRKIDPEKEKALSKAVTLANAAYPGVKRPASPKVAVPELLAAASGAKLAVSGLK